MAGLLQAVHDLAQTISKHTRTGREAIKDLSRGREAHIFNDDADLAELERKVWAEGSWYGKATGQPQRVAYDRFIWRAPAPIGRRIQTGRPDVPLSWVEVKGKIVKGAWLYHLVPRPRPAA
jgi:hypothetical protein